MTLEVFSNFTFRVLKDEFKKGWYYELYKADAKTIILTSGEFFESEGSARYAVIGHIHLLETSNFESERS